MAFNSYISLIKAKLGAKAPEVAVETLDHSGAASHTKPAADGILLDAVSPHNSGAEAGSETDSARLGDTATHEHGLTGITTEVEPVELLEDARGAAPGNGYDLGDTATHEREGGPSLDPAFQVTGDFAESHANLDSSLLGDTATHERVAAPEAHSIFTEFTFPTEQVSSAHGGTHTTDDAPAFGDSERVLSAQGSGSDEQVVGVTEYGTTDVGHTGGVFTFKSTSGMDSETERLAFSSERGSGPSGGVQKFDGPVAAASAEWHDDFGRHATSEGTAINDQTPADWNERGAPGGHELKAEWVTSAVGGSDTVHGEAVQDVFVTALVSRPEAESNVSVFGVGGGVDDQRAADLRVTHDVGQPDGFTVKFDGGPGPHDGGHDVKWEGPDFDATKNFAGEPPQHEGLMLPFMEQDQVVEPRSAAGILPYIEAQNAVEGDEPTLERQAPEFHDPSGGPAHDPVGGGSAAIDAIHATGTASALDAGFTISDDLVNSVSSLDSDADAPTTLLGDLHHGDQLYTGVNDGSLLGVHDAGHLDAGHHDLADVHHGHDAALDHLPHIDLDL